MCARIRHHSSEGLHLALRHPGTPPFALTEVHRARSGHGIGSIDIHLDGATCRLKRPALLRNEPALVKNRCDTTLEIAPARSWLWFDQSRKLCPPKWITRSAARPVPRE